MFQSVFYELAAILALAAVAGIIALRLRQPLIIAFIIVGVVVGPAGVQWVSASDQIETLAQIGIAILLFVVGLKLDVGLIRSVGPVALSTGIGQILFTSIIGFGLALALGFDTLTSAYVAVALTFSSTIIIVKLLSDKREIDSLHGRIAVGFLIVQDICVILAMILLPAFAGGGEGPLFAQVARLLAIGTVFVGGTFVMMRWVMPALLDRLARSQELLVLFAIAWAVLLAAVGDALGFSKEVGAFLGGVSIASTQYRDAIASRLTSLRDFLLLFFFIELGSRLDMTSIADQILPAAVLSVFVLVGNPLIVIVIMGYMGYRRRTGLLAGLTVAQISEFSLILMTLGVTLGHVGADALGLVTLVGIVTIGLSTYLIIYSSQLYGLLQKPLRIFERSVPYRELTDRDESPVRVDVIVMGLGRYGGRIARRLTQRGLGVLGVDFDPEALQESRQSGLVTQYGDVADPEFALALPLSSARMVVSTLPQLDVNEAVAHGLEVAGFDGSFIATAHDDEDAARLRLRDGVVDTLMPFSDAADQAADIIEAALDVRPTPTSAS
ncbi:MAG: cation:proton antiporter family protein [Coriobacteriia bacterium]|nr:cation:proton antiporter family protein [Coriobacteriia bacterium]